MRDEGGSEGKGIGEWSVDRWQEINKETGLAVPRRLLAVIKKRGGKTRKTIALKRIKRGQEQNG